MSNTPVLGNLAPLIPAGGNVDKAIRFYEQQLGFIKIYQDDEPPKIAIVKRDAVEIFLCKNDDKHLAKETSFRIKVKHIEQLYEDYLAKGRQRIHKNGKLQSKPWGTKEFAVLAQAGVCITFYESTETAAKTSN